MNQAFARKPVQLLKVRVPSTSSSLSASQKSNLFRDFKGADGDMRTVRELPRARPSHGGRFQNWKPALYIGPQINPLQRGLDFTFQDGKPIYVTSKKEADRKLEQIELGKKIVKCLAEMREIEELYIADNARKQAELTETQRWTPRSKGTEDIF